MIIKYKFPKINKIHEIDVQLTKKQYNTMINDGKQYIIVVDKNYNEMKIFKDEIQGYIL